MVLRDVPNHSLPRDRRELSHRGLGNHRYRDVSTIFERQKNYFDSLQSLSLARARDILVVLSIFSRREKDTEDRFFSVIFRHAKDFVTKQHVAALS